MRFIRKMKKKLTIITIVGSDWSVFDFSLFLTGTVVIFSTIGIACIGVGAYIVLRTDSQKREIEKNGSGTRKLIR